MANLILVSGCSGVGKTSFSRQYANVNNCFIIAEREGKLI